MRRFVFSAPDGSSDNGSATVVVIASSLAIASAQLAVHLTDVERPDLKNGMELLQDDAMVKGVVYSDVEGGRS